MRRVWNHLRFLLPYPLLVVTLAGIRANGVWMWSGIALLVVLALCGDELLPGDPGAPQDYVPVALDALLFATLPLIVALYVALIWQAVPPHELPAIAVDLQAWLGWQPGGNAGWAALAGGILSTSFMVGIAATNVAHVLMHQRNPLAVMFGKILLLFSFDVPLVISHLYGHHVNVGTREDHTTARRGESSYAFIWRSAVDGNLNAWRIEAARLRERGYASCSWRNRFLRGHLGSAIVAGGAWCLGGWAGMAVFLVCAVLSKSILELINYIQHYGIVRRPGTCIGLRHSWNSDRPVSTFLLFNVTRHSHHHAEPEMPFWGLQSYPDAPFLPKGYLTAICIALIPPWWHRHMAPALLDWDARFATPEEHVLAVEENRLSGVRQLIAAGARH